MNKIDSTNAQYHRSKISKRCAVKCLVAISEIVLPHGHISLSSYTYDSWDYGVYNMVDEIRRLKFYAKKYHELRHLLKETVE